MYSPETLQVNGGGTYPSCARPKPLCCICFFFTRKAIEINDLRNGERFGPPTLLDFKGGGWDWKLRCVEQVGGVYFLSCFQTHNYTLASSLKGNWARSTKLVKLAECYNSTQVTEVIRLKMAAIWRAFWTLLALSMPKTCLWFFCILVLYALKRDSAPFIN